MTCSRIDAPFAPRALRETGGASRFGLAVRRPGTTRRSRAARPRSLVSIVSWASTRSTPIRFQRARVQRRPQRGRATRHHRSVPFHEPAQRGRHGLDARTIVLLACSGERRRKQRDPLVVVVVLLGCGAHAHYYGHGRGDRTPAAKFSQIWRGARRRISTGVCPGEDTQWRLVDGRGRRGTGLRRSRRRSQGQSHGRGSRTSRAHRRFLRNARPRRMRRSRW